MKDQITDLTGLKSIAEPAAQVGTVILNYNGWEDTIECVRSVLSHSEIYSIVIIDNQSTDDSLVQLVKAFDFVSKEDPHFSDLYQSESDSHLFLIRAHKNGGFAYGNNLGIKYFLKQEKFNFIWLLNNDTLPTQQSLRNMLQEFSEDKVGLVGSYQYYMAEPEKLQSIGGGFDLTRADFCNYKSPKEHSKIVFPYGASMLFSKDCLQSVGLLEEGFFLYYEEIDYITRMQKLNWDFKVAAEAKVLHKHSGSIAKEASDFKTYYLTRNKVFFYRKHYPKKLLIPIKRVLKAWIIHNLHFKKISFVHLKALMHGLFLKIKS